MITGKVFLLDDNIDTDQIIPAQYLNLVPTIPEEYKKLGSYALSGLPDSYERFMKTGEDSADYTIIVGGKNFGCGSSREHAPVALGAAGIKAVIAESFARIFFRNSISTGEIYPIESENCLQQSFKTGDEAEINIEENYIKNLTSGEKFELQKLGEVKNVIDAGGIFAYAKQSGMIK